VQPTFGGGTCGTISCTDVFVTAFNLTINAPIYSTFLGNPVNDQGTAIATDSTGAAYVAGYTDGSFRTASPRQAASGGQRDAFVAKLAQPTMALGAATASSAESVGVLNLTVTLSAGAPMTITVDYATSNGSASAGSDYTAQGGTLTFAPGVTSQPIGIPILGDPNDEPNETFTVTLSNPVGGRLGTPASTLVTITDDDAPPTVAWQGASFSVGEPAGTALLPVTLSAASSFGITVAYATSNGSATAGVPPAGDYTATSGTLTFPAGVTSQHVSILITNDTAAEPSETINLTLSAPTNASLGVPNPATLTILDEETPPPIGDELYTYDPLGNILSKTGVGAYSYGAQSALCPTGALNKPHAAVSAVAASYSYDQNGNMLSGGRGRGWPDRRVGRGGGRRRRRVRGRGGGIAAARWAGHHRRVQPDVVDGDIDGIRVGRADAHFAGLAGDRFGAATQRGSIPQRSSRSLAGRLRGARLGASPQPPRQGHRPLEPRFDMIAPRKSDAHAVGQPPAPAAAQHAFTPTCRAAVQRRHPAGGRSAVRATRAPSASACGQRVRGTDGADGRDQHGEANALIRAIRSDPALTAHGRAGLSDQGADRVVGGGRVVGRRRR
jgi:Calx-beta domain/Beta-propeller repeat